MSYSGKHVNSSLTGMRISVSDLPIGIQFDFSEVMRNIMSVLDETDIFKEIKYKGNGIQYELIQTLWNIRNRTSEFLTKLIDTSGLDFEKPTEFLITSTVEFSSRTGELVPLVSNNNCRMFDILREYRYLVLYKLDVNTEEVLQSRKIFNIKKELSDMNIPRLMSVLSDSGLERINVELLEINPDWDFSPTPIISTHQKSKNGKYYVSRVPVFNHDWQLNGEFEPRILLHPNILPLTMKHYKRGESDV